MSMLQSIQRPSDVRRLGRSELEVLAKEIRDFLVASVSQTGGHLGPNLGVVELTLAAHRVFDSPRDRLVFDTGHQAYVHKLLTGRSDFARLRKRDGLSGYPSRAESDHDIVENSHASTALSWADGIARANSLAGHRDRHAVAIIGDGALTGGMAWEALNNIAEGQDRRLVIVVNDNGRSYSPTIGGMAHHLDALRTARGYETVLDLGKRALHRGGPPGRFAYDALHGLKKGMKDVLAPQGLFEDLGIKYLGPVDGHDMQAMEFALRRAKSFDGPVIVHTMTEKGRGYSPAEQDLADHLHSIGAIHPETGLPVAPSRFGWTSVFAEEIVALGKQRSDIVGVTAAMLHPVGLAPFSQEFPERTIDVGIAEQHALTSAAGMAFAGMHPVVALYATFLNRGYDQLMMDVALHRAGVTIVLDRAGVTGDDGPSHNGMWDLALLRTVPGLRLAAPRDEATLRAELREAVDVDDAPTVLRYPKGALPEPLSAVSREGSIDVLARNPGDGARRVLVIGVGAMGHTACEIGEALGAQGIGSLVVDPRWVLPVSDDLVKLAANHDLVVTLEDGLGTGGIGSAIRDALGDAGIAVPVQNHGLPLQFLSHASRNEIIAEHQMRAQDVARDAAAAVAALDEEAPAITGTAATAATDGG